MNQFARKLERIDGLGEIASKPGDHWWKDLLSLWRPSGVEAGEHGLRLAIRNGYMNFYRRGQSIACVSIDSKGTPSSTIHVKYIGASTTGPVGQAYASLQDKSIRWGTGAQRNEGRDYGGLDELKQWIAVVDHGLRADGRQGFSGDEKVGVDKLVAANSNVIDLEMGLPAWGEIKTASRIDLVTIETKAKGQTIVFWEAKLVTDGRIRCNADVVIDEKPEVLRQLFAYREFLKAENHVELVAKAYSTAAKLMVELRAMADSLGEVYPLGADILTAYKVNASNGIKNSLAYLRTGNSGVAKCMNRDQYVDKTKAILDALVQAAPTVFAERQRVTQLAAQQKSQEVMKENATLAKKQTDDTAKAAQKADIAAAVSKADAELSKRVKACQATREYALYEMSHVIERNNYKTAAAQLAIQRQEDGAKISGMVDKQIMYDMGQVIASANRIKGENFELYKKLGGPVRSNELVRPFPNPCQF